MPWPRMRALWCRLAHRTGYLVPIGKWMAEVRCGECHRVLRWVCIATGKRPAGSVHA